MKMLKFVNKNNETQNKVLPLRIFFKYHDVPKNCRKRFIKFSRSIKSLFLNSTRVSKSRFAEFRMLLNTSKFPLRNAKTSQEHLIQMDSFALENKVPFQSLFRDCFEGCPFFSDFLTSNDKIKDKKTVRLGQKDDAKKILQPTTI